MPGRSRYLAGGLAVGLSVYALYWVVGIVDTQIYRVTFLLIALVLTFLQYPARRGRASAVNALDWALIAVTLVALGWPLVDFSQFIYRAANPTTLDVICGTAALAIILEATRRTVGLMLPVSAAVFIVYAFAGPLLDRIGLGLIAHRGYDLDALVGTLYMTLEGIFGVPLDVAATYIILFTIYGAVLRVLRRRHASSSTGRLAVMGRSGERRRPRPHRDAGRLSARHGVRQRRRHHRHARLGRLAAAAAGAGYPADIGGAILVGGRHRRDPVAPDARRGGVPHRRVPAHLLPAGPGHGDDPDAALLPVDLPDDRSRLAPPGNARGRRSPRRLSLGS